MMISFLSFAVYFVKAFAMVGVVWVLVDKREVTSMLVAKKKSPGVAASDGIVKRDGERDRIAERENRNMEHLTDEGRALKRSFGAYVGPLA